MQNTRTQEINFLMLLKEITMALNKIKNVVKYYYDLKQPFPFNIF